MLDKFKGRLHDKAQDEEPAYSAKVAGALQQVQHTVIGKPAATPEPSGATSTINAGTTIIGKVVSDGTLKISGRIEGELKAATAVICEGAQVEGNVVADELTVSGRVKGTINAKRVRLQGTAVVEGDIFHQSLSVEENALFEGMSRRQENPTAASSGVTAKSPTAQPCELPKVASGDAIAMPDQRGYGMIS